MSYKSNLYLKYSKRNSEKSLYHPRCAGVLFYLFFSLLKFYLWPKKYTTHENFTEIAILDREFKNRLENFTTWFVRVQ